MESVAEALSPGLLVAGRQGRPVIASGIVHSSCFVESADVGAIAELHSQFGDARHAPVHMPGYRQGLAILGGVAPRIDIRSIRWSRVHASACIGRYSGVN